MMLRCVVIITLAAMMGGCYMTREVYFADGSKGHSITCEGFVSDMGKCFEMAGEICSSKGYSVEPVQPGVMMTNNLFIKCKEP